VVAAQENARRALLPISVAVKTATLTASLRQLSGMARNCAVFILRSNQFQLASFASLTSWSLDQQPPCFLAVYLLFNYSVRISIYATKERMQTFYVRLPQTRIPIPCKKQETIYQRQCRCTRTIFTPLFSRSHNRFAHRLRLQEHTRFALAVIINRASRTHSILLGNK